MQTRCPACYKWTSLPETQRVNGAFHVECEHCREELPAVMKNRRYLLCRVCNHYYLRDLEFCPICPPPGNAVAVPWLRLMLDHPADGAAARLLPRPLSESYCVSLWEDYQREQAGARDRVQAGQTGGSNGRSTPRSGPSAAPTAPPAAILPPEPMAMFDLGEITPVNGNSHANGTGTGASADPITIKAHEGLDGVDYELIADQARLAEVAELLAAAPILSVDTETDGLDPYGSRLLLLQISVPGKCYIVDCQRRDLSVLPLKPILESNRTLKLLQNAKFDYKMLKHIAGIELCNIFDTMLAERLLTAGRAREIGLKSLASKYAGVTMDKTIRKSFVGVRGDGYLSREQLAYAARDALILFEIHTLQTAELKKWRLEKVAKLENECVAAVGDMELNGLVIDTTRWRAILEKVAVERDNAAVALNDLLATVALQSSMFGVPVINLNSNAQLMNAFARLGVVLEDTREQTLQKQGDNPAIKKLLDYRGHEKTLSAFGEELLKLINTHTGRMHPDFNQYGADTGRFSCTNPNVQQIPSTSDFRMCFVASEGYKLVTCVAAGTRIATTRGLIPVEQVIAGDRVLQEDGSTRLVQRNIDQGARPAVKLRTAMGYELVATPEHRVRVLDEEGDYVWREAGSLETGTTVAIKLGRGEERVDHGTVLAYSESKHFNAVNRSLPATVSEDLAHLLGYITGDGTFIHDYVGWVVNWNDADLLERLQQISTTLFSYEPKTYLYRGVADCRIFSTQIKDWLLSLGSSKEQVPDFLWSAPEELIAAYLRGLFEADGSVQSTATGKISFSTVHEKLASQVQELLRAIGVASIRSKLVHGKGCGYIWLITLPSAWNKTFAQRVGFLSERKSQTLAGLLERKVKQEHGAMPNMAHKARQLAYAGGATDEARRLLANTRNRGSVVTMAVAERVRAEAPELATQLGLHHLLDNSLIFDRVVEVSPAGIQHVYDLTVEETSTYITEGFVSHNCDYSQAELRILAELSGDPGFVDAFVSGGDLHAITASQMFQVPLADVSKAQRSAAKSINFGLAYGRGPGSLALQLGVTPDAARELIDKYFKAYQGVQKWLDKAARDSVRLGYSETTLGRKRFYDVPTDRNDPEYRTRIASIERQGKNTPIQGGNADMTKIALIYLRDTLRGYDARIINTVHDEIVVEAIEGQAEEVKHIVETQMVRAGAEILQRVPVVADAAVGDYWKK